MPDIHSVGSKTGKRRSTPYDAGNLTPLFSTRECPECLGWNCFANLRRDAKTTLLPVMMLSAVASQNDQSIAFYEGADDYLTKPFDAEMLVFRVEELLGRSRRVLAS